MTKDCLRLFNLFEKPIICDLKPSANLALNFIILATIPLASTFVYFEKYPWIPLCVGLVVFAFCCFYIFNYVLRAGHKSLKRLKLHNHKALLTFNNDQQYSAKIQKVCLASEWVVILCKNSLPIIIDRHTVSMQTYKSIRRQISIFKNEAV